MKADATDEERSDTLRKVLLNTQAAAMSDMRELQMHECKFEIIAALHEAEVQHQ